MNSTDLQQSIAKYQVIEKIEHELASSYYDLANLFLEREQTENAIFCYQRVITLKPNSVEAYKKLGTALLKHGRVEEAMDTYQKALNHDPHYLDASYIDVYKELGLLFEQQGQPEYAIACYQQILNLNPNSIETYENLGIVLIKQGQLEEASNCYQMILKLNSDHVGAYNNLGVILMKQGRLEPAIACYQKVLALNPNYVGTYNNLGLIFTEKGWIDQAIACYRKAIDINPEYIDAHCNLGIAFTEQGNYQKAIKCYTQALEIEPSYALAHFNYALLLLLTGNFIQGFTEYEWRLQNPQDPEYYTCRNKSVPLWDGSKLDGQILLLHSEHGLGDTIQFIRYAPLVAQLGARVVVECLQPLVRLLTTVAGVEQVVVKGEALPKFHIHAPLMSLPRILRTTLENISAQVPYLNIPESPFQLRTSPKNRLSVGIVWAGSPTHQRDRTRSCPLSYFFKLLSTPNVDFYSLQKGPRVAEIAECERLQDLSVYLHDLGDTAAVIAQLDLVISVDTSVAHLAGAINKPVWLLLSFNPDWRWMLEREDSPWYPSMRLFRQKSPGDWAGLLHKVEKALQTLVGKMW